MQLAKHSLDIDRSLAKIFSQSTIRSAIRDGKSSKIINRYRYIKRKENTTNLEVLQFIYRHLDHNYRNEYIFKNTLLNYILEKYRNDLDYTILDEFKVGSSIADFVLLNGEVHIYEIKTPLDSLEKLEKQILDYMKFANKVTIVCSSDHARKILETHEGSNIGLIEYTKNGDLKTIQAAKHTELSLNYETIFKCLRKDEYSSIIKELFGFTPDVPNTLYFRECLGLVSRVNVSKFHKLAFKKIKERGIEKSGILLNNNIPYELKHICYFLNFTKSEFCKLHNFLQKSS